MSLETLAEIFRLQPPNGTRRLSLSCGKCLSLITVTEKDGRVQFTCFGGCTEDELMGGLAAIEPRFATWWLNGGLTDEVQRLREQQGISAQRRGVETVPEMLVADVGDSALGSDREDTQEGIGGFSDGRGIEEGIQRTGAVHTEHALDSLGGDDRVLRSTGAGSSTLETQTPRQGFQGRSGEAVAESERHLGEDQFQDSDLHLNGQVDDVFRWKTILYDRAKVDIEHALKTNQYLPQLIGDYTDDDFLPTVQKHHATLKAPSRLNEADVGKTLREMAVSLRQFYAPKAVNGTTESDPDEGRHAIDLFDAYTASRAESREYTWGGLIRRGCSAVITGQMAAGKSTLLMCLARAWALGELFLGRICIPSKTLVVCSQKEFEAWEDTIGFWQLKGHIFAIESTKVQFKEKREQADWFEREMLRLGTTTFILDTLFDFFGMPPNTSGDQNRIVMAEQGPVLEIVKARGWSGIVSGHPPKGEAHNPNPREPEEAFGGHTAWTAQHRMRMRLRRTGGPPALVTGKGGYGDEPVFPEQAVMFDEDMRLVTLGGIWTKHLGVVALPVVMAAIESLGGFGSMAKLVKETERSESFLRAGCRAGRDARPQLIWKEGKGRSTQYRLTDPNGNSVSSDENEWH